LKDLVDVDPAFIGTKV